MFYLPILSEPGVLPVDITHTIPLLTSEAELGATTGANAPPPTQPK